VVFGYESSKLLQLEFASLSLWRPCSQELIEKVAWIHRDEQDAQYLSTRAEDAEQRAQCTCPDSSQGAWQPTSTTLRTHLVSKTTSAHWISLSCTSGQTFRTGLRFTKPEESKTQTTILPDIPPDVFFLTTE
jgi:hypothetical protein